MGSIRHFVVIISGKRKSGKDYISSKLLACLGPNKCAILPLSGPLKKQYAKDHNLDFDRLLDATEYKEHYRQDMIQWGEEKRNQDPGYFCRLATEGEGSEKDIWIISDARRLSDVVYFRDKYKEDVITIRVEADLSVRQQRGFVFTEGIDDAESECGLDSGCNWDIVIYNNNNQEKLEDSISKILKRIPSTS
ncbi:phosphomevalonate kinase-like isoform X1 [Biomphalaria glabrata]|uniref:Phosphomevalonate kinase n=1 Tax=Biomphalaria glabrata TaxID=6526 RepID=A0A2C9K5N9_BIOGL|nr:phosphomevalonate kinase-like isoform X1 [Biomphalaria glabrata]KAI8789641.1 phosphomevalonate kinase [Biomphalaria glabrata]